MNLRYGNDSPENGPFLLIAQLVQGLASSLAVLTVPFSAVFTASLIGSETPANDFMVGRFSRQQHNNLGEKSVPSVQDTAYPRLKSNLSASDALGGQLLDFS